MLCGYSAKLKIRKVKNENKGDQGVSSIMSLGKERSKTGKGKAAFSKKNSEKEIKQIPSSWSNSLVLGEKSSSNRVVKVKISKNKLKNSSMAVEKLYTQT